MESFSTIYIISMILISTDTPPPANYNMFYYGLQVLHTVEVSVSLLSSSWFHSLSWAYTKICSLFQLLHNSHLTVCYLLRSSPELVYVLEVLFFPISLDISICISFLIFLREIFFRRSPVTHLADRRPDLLHKPYQQWNLN